MNNHMIGIDDEKVVDSTTSLLSSNIDIPPSSNVNVIKVNVRNAEDPLLIVDMLGDERVEQLKNRILNAKNKIGNRIRLVYNGKMLADHQTISESKLINNCFVICSITAPLDLNLNPTAPIISQLPPSAAPLPPSSSSTLPTLNHLTNNTISPNLISPSLQHQLLINGNRQQQQRDNEFILDMESTNGLHIDVSDVSPIQASNIFRDSCEVVAGMGLAFILGPLALFWLSKDYLTRNVKFGIIMGVMLNILISLSKITSGGGTQV